MFVKAGPLVTTQAVLSLLLVVAATIFYATDIAAYQVIFRVISAMMILTGVFQVFGPKQYDPHASGTARRRRKVL